METRDRARGACACGSVKFVIFLPPKFCIHCHCTMCRKVHGAALVTWVGVAMESFKIFGQENLRWYRHAEATKATRRGFCGNCGSPMVYLSTKFPGDVHVPRASLEGSPPIAPNAHIYYEHHVDWWPFEDKLLHLGGPDGTSPLES